MRKLLLDGEQLEIRCHPHARTLLWPVSVGLISIMLGSAALAKLQPKMFLQWAPTSETLREPLIAIVVVVVALIWIFYPLRRALRWTGTRYFLTNQRLLVRQGLLRRHLTPYTLAHVLELRAVQNWRQRMVDSGDLQLRLHPDTVVTVKEIPHWSEFNKDAQQFWAKEFRASMQQTSQDRDYAGVVRMSEKELRKLGRDN